MKNGFKKIAFMAIVAGCMMILMHISVYAKYDTVVGTHSYYGGGYAVTGQIPDISYSYEIYVIYADVVVNHKIAKAAAGSRGSCIIVFRLIEF